MKRMTTVIAVMALMLTAAAGLQAQQRTVERTFGLASGQSVELDLKFGETIAVKAWDRSEVSFRADIEINQGKLNDALELEFEESGRGLQVKADYDKEKIRGGRSADCPSENYSTYSWEDDGNRAVVCSRIRYEIYIPRDAALKVESISGDIELTGLSGAIHAKSISGFVDLSWPDGKPADFNLKTISGEAYTDIDGLEFTNKKDHIPLVGYKINAHLGTSGPAVLLESISGNIYLRKS